MLSDDACVVPLDAARELLRDRGQAFIRPDSDSKAFEGGLYNDIGLATATRGTSVSEKIFGTWQEQSSKAQLR
jgi:hypothetical protein